jgi:exopolysaccharide biosynthesis polyprenyl glycosylphosphotransferase
MESSPVEINMQLDSVSHAKLHQISRSIPRHAQWRLLTFSLVITDLLMIGLAFRAAYFIRFELSLSIFTIETIPSFTFYQRLVLVLIPVWLSIFILAGLYDRQNLLGGTGEYALLINATTAGMFLVIAAGFLDPGFVFARGWLLLAWVFAILLTFIGRFSLRRIVYSMRKQGFFLSPAVIVGANSEGLSLAEQLLGWKTSGLNLLGFVDKKIPIGTQICGDLRVLGTVEQLDAMITQYGIEEVILASSSISSRDKVMEIFQQFGVRSNVKVRMSSGLYEIVTTGLTVKEFAYVPLVGVNQVRLKGLDRILKAILDYMIAIPAIIFLAPILIVIAVAIKLDSPGPVIIRRGVMGMNKRKFDAYKFRTMFVNGDEILAGYPELQEELSRNHKLKNDPRITRLGNLLRKTSLDELPQLINVLRREMSLVGPRMITPEEVGKYTKWDINLLTVRPGITGLWQISGRSDVTYEERVRLDMYYIRNWSIWLDLQILFQTIPAVLKMRGAY